MDSLPLQRSKDLVLVINTPKGRGVFAAANIPSRTIIDICPVLVLDPQENKEHIEKTSLYHYTYNWPSFSPALGKHTTQAVIFGLGSMFNHSRNQNVGWTRDVERLIVTYQAVRDIRAGEELCISYGSKLTFVDTDAPASDDEADSENVLNNIQID